MQNHSVTELMTQAVQHHRCGELQQAETLYRVILSREPQQPQVLNLLGTAKYQQGKLQEAHQLIQHAISCNGDEPDFFCNLGSVQQGLNQYAQAAESYQRALALSPDNAELYSNLAVVRRHQGQWQEAEALYRQSLQLVGDSAKTLSNLGVLLTDMGNYSQATSCFQDALNLTPQDPELHWNYSLTLLHQGKFSQAWPSYLMREKRVTSSIHWRFPRLRGKYIESESILISREQGIGDEIFFAGSYQSIVEQATRCFIECDSRLQSLLQRTFPTCQVITSDELHELSLEGHPEILQIPAGSVPIYSWHTLAAVTAAKPYFIADSQRRDYWQQRFKQLGAGLKVGLAWHSQRTQGKRGLCHCHLSDLSPLLALENIHLVNLQSGEAVEQLQQLDSAQQAQIYQYHDVDIFNDIEELAAMMAELDMVVTTATMIADLAGALGVNTILLLNKAGSWRCFGTEGFPSYPSMTVTKQTILGNWQQPVQKTVSLIQHLQSQHE